MKTTVFAGMVLFAHTLMAQSTYTPTAASIDVPNLSVEQFDDKIITGFTEIGPSHLYTPTFHITDNHGNMISSFHLYFQDDPFYLMDFTINTDQSTILLTAITAVTDPGTPYKMIAIETDFSGNILHSYMHYERSGLANMIPHQIYYSPSEQQVVIVGSKIDGYMAGTPNVSQLSKQGFVLGLRTDLQDVIFNRLTDSFTSNITSDYDMMENLTEVPGMGYFISGSANSGNPFINNQNLALMSLDYSGTMLGSSIHNLTNAWMSGTSVQFVPDYNMVYVLCNSSVHHTYLVGRFSPSTTTIIGNWWKHEINGLNVSTDVNVNGFKLANMSNDHILVTGLIDRNPSSTMMAAELTPFEMVLSMNLDVMENGKYFNSSNNSPLAGYFSLEGSSVLINTPDISSYDPRSGTNILVNHNTGHSCYDMWYSDPLAPATDCQSEITVTTTSMPTLVVGSLTALDYNYYVERNTPMTESFKVQSDNLCGNLKQTTAHLTTTAAIHPNPASESAVVSVSGPIATIAVSDIHGNSIRCATHITWNKAELDLNPLPSGIYMVLITDKSGTIYRERLIKK